MPDEDFEKLATRLTDPDASLPEPASVHTGAEAAAAGNALLLREYGSEDAVARALRPGRPSLGASPRGASPTVRGRISVEDFVAFKLLEVRTGKRQSDLVREAVQLLLAKHEAES